MVFNMVLFELCNNFLIALDEDCMYTSREIYCTNVQCLQSYLLE